MKVTLSRYRDSLSAHGTLASNVETQTNGYLVERVNAAIGRAIAESAAQSALQSSAVDEERKESAAEKSFDHAL